MCWHKWTKWKQYTLNWIRDLNGKSVVTNVEVRQKRECIKCNKQEDELVSFT